MTGLRLVLLTKGAREYFGYMYIGDPFTLNKCELISEDGSSRDRVSTRCTCHLQKFLVMPEGSLLYQRMVTYLYLRMGNTIPTTRIISTSPA